jgi:hypothetical protein
MPAMINNASMERKRSGLNPGEIADSRFKRADVSGDIRMRAANIE